MPMQIGSMHWNNGRVMQTSKRMACDSCMRQPARRCQAVTSSVTPGGAQRTTDQLASPHLPLCCLLHFAWRPAYNLLYVHHPHRRRTGCGVRCRINQSGCPASGQVPGAGWLPMQPLPFCCICWAHALLPCPCAMCLEQPPLPPLVLLPLAPLLPVLLPLSLLPPALLPALPAPHHQPRLHPEARLLPRPPGPLLPALRPLLALPRAQLLPRRRPLQSSRAAPPAQQGTPLQDLKCK